MYDIMSIGITKILDYFLKYIFKDCEFIEYSYSKFRKKKANWSSMKILGLISISAKNSTIE